MDDCQLGCCIFLIVIVSLATGIPCLYYAYKCSTPGDRAKHKNDACKSIHNDDSVKALMAFGYIFSIPWMIALCACLSMLNNNSVSPSENDGNTSIVVCIPV